MNADSGFDPGHRLQELLIIPERDRTDAQWDEINELEIQMGPGYRLPGISPAKTHGGPGKPRAPREPKTKRKGRSRIGSPTSGFLRTGRS